jgi:stage II sporulation protein AA (anti-sigma F factor antagonist)
VTGTPPPPEALSIEVSRPSDGVIHVKLAGEVDILSVGELRRRIEELDGQMPAHVVFDLGGLLFIDSSGINALVQAVKAIEEQGGSGVLTAPSPEARRVLEIIGVSQVVSVVQDLDAALRPPPEEPPTVAGGAS